ncbi:hypothetical protein L3N51_01499 [Metallosphaera sp. J1]|uniref:hypothetical protein n=1 Tax=Metallosphaera javensis (ex Hofmann et al. 2022) TaxID=99938 RepID=UPI001EE04018|nr:hypothetical protein [Metallosphaera javensis (ex Hofmann et al. 2022)]MCG3109209.1 hypothetical protein [Metallosphaera javensis (ex Hofmann et al. 2022)]
MDKTETKHHQVVKLLRSKVTRFNFAYNLFGILSAFGGPGSFLVEGLILLVVYIIAVAVVEGGNTDLGRWLNWYSQVFTRDGASSAILLVGVILSMVPMLNIFIIPYSELLASLMVRRYYW